MSFGFFFILLGFVVFAALAGLVGLVALAVSPDVRHLARKTATVIAPLAVVGLGLLVLIGFAPTNVQVQPAQVAEVQHVAATPVSPALPPLVPSAVPVVHSAQTVASPNQAKLVAGIAVLNAVLGVAVAMRWGGRHVSVAGLGLFIPAVLILIALIYQARQAEHVRVRYEQDQAAARLADIQSDAAHEQALLEKMQARREAGAIPVEAELAAADQTKAPLDPSQPVSITEFRRGSGQSHQLTAIPAWVESWTSESKPEEQRLVLTSRRYSTVAEAEVELLGTLRPQVQAFLQQTGLDADTRALSRSDVDAAGAIVGRVEEQFLVDLGSSQEPVYRVTWQIELGPKARAIVWGRSQAAHRDARLLQLAAGVGLLTLIFGAWATYFRVDDATQGRYRGRLQLAAAAITLAGAAATMLA